MHASHNYLAGLTARRADPHTVQVTLVRIDTASGRMVFEELAMFSADPATPADVAQCLLLGARRLLERAEVYPEPQQ